MPEPTPMLTPLVISGAPRSGTSLVYNLFDGHSRISWLLNEGFFFENLQAYGTDPAIFVASALRDVDSFVAGLRDKQLVPPLDQPYVQSEQLGSVSEFRLEWAWDEAAFRAAIAQGLAAVGDVAGLWALLARACVAGMGQPARDWSCIKAPDYGKSAEAALATVPQARALVVLRDPLYALDSLKRSRDMRGAKQLTWPVFAACVFEMRAMLRRIKDCRSPRLMWLRYEDLVAEPRPVMERVAQWLGIPFEPCLLEPTMLGRQWPGISSFKATRGIETAPAARRVMALDAQEQATARRCLGEYEEFGYRL